MTLRFPTEPWIKELGNQLNANASYERSAKDWEGDFIFVVEPDAAFRERVELFLGLYHGKCTAAEVIAEPDGHKAEYRISAPYGVWRLVVEGKLDPIQGLMTRKLKLQEGANMMKIMRYPKAAKEIIMSCSKVPTEF